MPAKPKADIDRCAVTATNHETGEAWSIHDTRAVCESELNRKLAEWTTDGRSVHVTVTGPYPITG